MKICFREFSFGLAGLKPVGGVSRVCKASPAPMPTLSGQKKFRKYVYVWQVK